MYAYFTQRYGMVVLVEGAVRAPVSLIAIVVVVEVKSLVYSAEPPTPIVVSGC